MYWALVHYTRARAFQVGFRTVKYTEDFKCIFEKLNFVWEPCEGSAVLFLP